MNRAHVIQCDACGVRATTTSEILAARPWHLMEVRPLPMLGPEGPLSDWRDAIQTDEICGHWMIVDDES